MSVARVSIRQALPCPGGLAARAAVTLSRAAPPIEASKGRRVSQEVPEARSATRRSTACGPSISVMTARSATVVAARPAVISRIITVRHPEATGLGKGIQNGCRNRLPPPSGSSIRSTSRLCSGPRPKSRVRRRGRAAAAKACALRVSPGRILRPVMENPALERAVKNSPRPWWGSAVHTVEGSSSLTAAGAERRCASPAAPAEPEAA